MKIDITTPITAPAELTFDGRCRFMVECRLSVQGGEVTMHIGEETGYRVLDAGCGRIALEAFSAEAHDKAAAGT